MSLKILRWIWLMLLVPALVYAENDDSSRFFKAGVQAFQKGSYEEAIAFFKQAEAEGNQSPNLYYNLGAAAYKAGKFEAAKENFQKLTIYPEWRPLALYNLGLTAEIRGDRETAKIYYFEAFRAARTSSRIKELAALKLQEMEDEAISGDALPAAWYGIFSASSGYDDNAVLAPDNEIYQISKKGDAFVDLYALGGVLAMGDTNDGLGVDAGTYIRFYAEESEYNFGTLFGGITRYLRYNDWQARIGMLVNADFVDGGFYATTPTFRLVADRIFNKVRIRVANDFGWIEAASGYGYLTGIRNRTTVELRGAIPNGRISTGYGFEYNDRQDLQLDDLFFSYSPIHHKLSAGIDYFVTSRLTMTLRGEFRKSLYPEANNPDRPESLDKRDDDRIVISLGSEYRLYSSLDLFAEFQHTDNESSFSRYSYTSNQVMLGVRKLF